MGFRAIIKLAFLCSFEEVYSFFVEANGVLWPCNVVFLTGMLNLRKLDSDLCFLGLYCDFFCQVWISVVLFIDCKVCAS